MATPLLARSRSVAWKAGAKDQKSVTLWGVAGAGDEKGSFQKNLQSAPMNQRPISGQSLLGELLKHILQLSSFQRNPGRGLRQLYDMNPNMQSEDSCKTHFKSMLLI